MTSPLVYEGTWDELAARADELRSYPRLMLIVPTPDRGAAIRSGTELSPQERVRLLDAVAERNRHVPPLPSEAFERETLYADDEQA